MEHSDTFGNWLRQRRRLLGMTQSELADCAGCSPITVRKMESDERRPAAASLRRSLALLSRTADTINIVESLEELALDLAGQEQDAALAARLLGTAENWRAQHNVPAPADVVAPLAAARAPLATVLGEGFAAATQRGRGLLPEEAAAL